MRTALSVVTAIFAILLLPHAALADATLWRKLNEPGHFAIMRHALAPGYGDPAGMRVEDCATQRNLDDIGRAQARAIGEEARSNGLTAAQIVSCQWCRCKETARLLGYGEPEELPALNSLFGRPENKEPNMRALKAYIAARPQNAGPLVLVSHQVTINALAGQTTRSGEVVILRHTGGGNVEVVGSIPSGITGG